MILPSVKEIVRYHPYLLPALICVFVLYAITWPVKFLCSFLTPQSCPGCPKRVCIVACPEVSRQLDEIDTKLKEEGL